MQTIRFDAWLTESVSEVVESMCFVSSEDGTLPSELEDPLWVSRRLSFRGPQQGCFGLRAPISTARMLASNLLGQEEEQLSDAQAAEALGEIANMICGTLLCRINSQQAFELSPPCSDQASEKPPCRERVCRMFSLDGNALIAWIEVETSNEHGT